MITAVPSTDRLIYLAHPVRGDVTRNRLRAMLWVKWLATMSGATVIAPWITDVALWDDSDPAAREHGLQKCRTTLSRCDELWAVGGEGASEGMQREMTWALEQGVKVVDASTMVPPWLPWNGVAALWDISEDPLALAIFAELSGWSGIAPTIARDFKNYYLGTPVPPPKCKGCGSRSPGRTAEFMHRGDLHCLKCLQARLDCEKDPARRRLLGLDLAPVPPPRQQSPAPAPETHAERMQRITGYPPARDEEGRLITLAGVQVVANPNYPTNRDPVVVNLGPMAERPMADRPPALTPEDFGGDDFLGPVDNGQA